VRFRDRADAGRRLAPLVAERGLDRPVVLGMARGGVAVASEVARLLGAPLDVLVVRKLGYPPQPELAMGAIGEGGAYVLNTDLLAQLGVPAAVVGDVAARESAELDRRLATYRAGRRPVALHGRAVVLVDDGLATGATARAAVSVLRSRGAGPIVLAVPVAPPAAVEALLAEGADVVCVEVSDRFFGIGQWYDDFRQVGDEEVRRLLVGQSDLEPGVELELGGEVEIEVEIEVEAEAEAELRLPGMLEVPPEPKGLVVFAHGSGSSRLSPRHRPVADALHVAGMATLLFDLLTADESADRAEVFDIEVLGSRLVAASDWARQRPELASLPLGLFGACTGTAAAIVAAARIGPAIRAIVSRGGRPDLAPESDLHAVAAPVLLIVGSEDPVVLERNRWALGMLAQGSLEVVPGATHLFEEPGTLQIVARSASAFFSAQLR
jgi:predicted phosphoribosyltransferase/dienelactone hydrolase